MKKFRLALFVYSLVCNIPICTVLCFVSLLVGCSSIVNGALVIDCSGVNWLFVLYNFLLGLAIALAVCNFLPLTRIGKWFTGLFHVRNDTYKGNMPYRLLATLIFALIYYIAINPPLLLLNWCLGVYETGADAGMFYLTNLPFMLVSGYVSSLLSDMPAYQVAKRIYPDF